MNYYRRFMADYGAKTAALSLAEHGAYNLLLDTCYSTERGLPASYEALNRLCRAMSKSEQDAVRSVADAFFPVGEDGLRHNPRADEEITKAQATIAKQRESGVESATKRWSTDGSTHKSTDGSTHKSTDADAIQPPTSIHQPPTPKHQPSTTNRRSKTPVASLPGWLDPEPWKQWIQIRPARARTIPAQKAAIAKLEQFREAGHDPNAIVATSLANGWQGLFAPKGNWSMSLAEQNRLAGEEAQRRFEQEQHERS